MPAGPLVTVLRAADLAPGSARHVHVNGTEVALANVDGVVYAMEPSCPHLGGPLGEGRLEGCVLSCPWHGWQFDVTTGENEFDHAITIEMYGVAVEDGDVKVALP